MSDDVLQFVPTSPDWQPTPESAERAVALASELFPDAYDVSAAFHDEVTVFHPGPFWEGVACPRCGQDLEAWWDEAMVAASETGFTDLAVTTPCCGAQTTLNDLAYRRPLRFGRFALEVLNPGVGDSSADQDGQLAKALGSPLAKVWLHI